MAPNEVDASNEGLVRARLYPPKSLKKLRWRYDVSDTVRIATTRHMPFAKGYATGNWTRELFVIATRQPTVPVTYTLRDLMDEPIKGKFYEPELHKVSSQQLFVIDKILKTRLGTNGKINYYLSWIGYPPKFNSWVDEIIE